MVARRPVATGHNPHARIAAHAAHRVLDRITGLTVAEALTVTYFSAAYTCEAVARVLEQAAAIAEHNRGLSPDELIVGASRVGDGESVVRVRRQAHGQATWITTHTTDIEIDVHEVDDAAEGAR